MTAINIKNLPAVIDDLPAEEYHSMTDYVSNSMESMFLESPREYQSQFIDKTTVKETSDAMRWGTALHALLLEPELIDSVAVRVPDSVLNDKGHRRGKPWTDWKAQQSPDVFLWTGDEWEHLVAAVETIRRHPKASVLLSEPDAVEQSIFWLDEKTGLKRKCRIDVRKGRFIGDVKTSADVTDRAFSRSVNDFGYHRQGTFYSDGVKAAGLIEDPEFILIPVTKKPPFICYPRTIDVVSQQVARLQIDTGLKELAACYDTGDWRLPGEDDLPTIGLPLYELRNHGVI